MNEQKSFLTYVGEMIDKYRTDRRTVLAEDVTPQQPGRLHPFLRWLTPNGGTLLLIAALILTQNVWARQLAAPAAPGPSATTVNYQGRLADSGGTPLDGTYGMSFSLWDAASDGNLVWGSESHPAVPVSEGLFSVGLGSQTSGGIPTSVWNGDRYLEVTVGGETLAPRELIRSVPIAGMALTLPDGAVSKAKLGSDVHLVMIQSGRVGANSISSPGWNLHQGSGDRTYIVNVTFGQSFTSAPTVQVSLSGLDFVNDGSGHRVSVYARNVTTNGFELVFHTWADTKLNGGTTTWIAYGPQRNT